MKYEYFLESKDLPAGFNYPDSYKNHVKNENVDFEPWSFLISEEMASFNKGLRERYDNRVLIPFARRLDNDDVACFDGKDKSNTPAIMIIHDYASMGWELKATLKTFDEWLKYVAEDSEIYNEE